MQSVTLRNISVREIQVQHKRVTSVLPWYYYKFAEMYRRIIMKKKSRN